MADVMLPLVGAIDQGTQSSRFMIFDKTAKVIVVVQKEHSQKFPKPGWCEHDPKEIIASVTACIAEAIEQLQSKGLSVTDIKAVGITNQRETTVVWDKSTGEPLHNAVVWLDTRTHETCEDLKLHNGGDKDWFRQKCGLPISTYFSGVKLKWLIDNVPAVKEKVDKQEALFGTIDSWLVYCFGGVHITDVTNASRTMLMDLDTCNWDAKICESFGVPMHVLPEIKSSSEVYCTFKDGPLKGIPIASCLGDQQSACVGHCLFQAGESKNTYGTGCFMLMNTGTSKNYSHSGLLTTVCYKLGPNAPTVYALEGSVAIAGVGISWLKDNMKFISDPKESEALAASVEDTGGVYLVPAFSGLFAPHWREDSRGIIMGLTQYTTHAHIVRAMLEAVCFQGCDVVKAMREDSGVEIHKMKVDGGMTANKLLMQTQSDLLGCQVLRPQMAETTALGCAFAAGLAVGVWSSQDELLEVQHRAVSYSPFDPKLDAADRKKRLDKWEDTLKRTYNWVD